jgi:hypothetical protein
MGNDGGTVATKRDMIKTAKPEHARAAGHATREDIAGSRLTTCALSNVPLYEPVVCDDQGNLFNKEALLSAVLEKRLPAAFLHVRKFTKDTFAIRPTWIAVDGEDGSAAGAGAGAGASSAKTLITSADTTSHALFTCPVTGVAGNGRHIFVALRGCGCVVAEKAFMALKGEAACPACGLAVIATLSGGGGKKDREGAVRLAQTVGGGKVKDGKKKAVAMGGADGGGSATASGAGDDDTTSTLHLAKRPRTQIE